MARTSKGNISKTNIWDFFKSISDNFINKGVVLPFLAMLIFLVMYLNVPNYSRADILVKIIESFEHWHILGWVISVIVTIAWAIQSKSKGKMYDKEMERIAKEKSELQKLLTEKNHRSSKNN